MDAVSRIRVDHVEVELVRVLVQGLLAKALQRLLLLIVVLRPEPVVFLLLQKSKLLAALRLVPLSMGLLVLDGVA